MSANLCHLDLKPPLLSGLLSAHLSVVKREALRPTSMSPMPLGERYWRIFPYSRFSKSTQSRLIIVSVERPQGPLLNSAKVHAPIPVSSGRLRGHNAIPKSGPNIVQLDDGTTAFWLGNPNAEKLIIYFPGGAYFIPALLPHFELVSALIDGLKRNDKEVGVLFLTYDLAPHAQWPRQLVQGVALVKYAIEALGKWPSNIILQGDSAGAHLALAVMSYLAENHSHESIPALSISENLRGALLLSPWIDFKTNHESFRTNAGKDTLPAKCISQWGQAIFGNSEMDRYSHPCTAPAGWWRRLPVERIFVGVGRDEIFLDPITSLAYKMKEEHSDVVISRVHGEFHAEPVTDFALKLPPGVQFHAMSAWLKETFL